MDIPKLAHDQTLNRIVIGAGLILFPSRVARIWIGAKAGDERVKVLARAMGARDLALGAGGLAAIRDGDSEWIRRTFAAQALADGVDFVAILGAGAGVPLWSRIFGGTMAAGSAAVAAAYALRTGED